MVSIESRSFITMEKDSEIPGTLNMRDHSARLAEVLVFLGVFCAAMAFALYTDHAWEDYYITFRASKNLATGHGLVFTEGQKLHTFTSPLGVLLPAALSAATGNTSDELVLWLFRILSGLALAYAAVLLLQIARRNLLNVISTIALIGMFAVDAKTLDFTINGQETGLQMLFLVLTLRALMVPARSSVMLLGIAWAGLMWTRPDGFVYIGTLALGFLVFRPTRDSVAYRRNQLKLYLKAGVLAAFLYSPWRLGTWYYYGTPVPHTVIAKGLGRHIDIWNLLRALLLYPFGTLFFPRSFDPVFLPSYALMGGWPQWAALYGRIVTWICSFYWCIPRGMPKARALSLALMLAIFYVDQISPFPFPWYLPSCTLLAIVVIAQIIDQISKVLIRHQTRARALVYLFAGTCLAFNLTLMLGSAYQLRIQQREIESGTRREIGLWLKQNAASKSDAVFLEPLGYIGYFSQLKMLDFPGMSSPEVVAARGKLGSDNAAGIIRELRPDWLVLRPYEIQSISQTDRGVLARLYSQARTFDISDRVGADSWLPGRSYLEHDQIFTVYRRK